MEQVIGYNTNTINEQNNNIYLTHVLVLIFYCNKNNYNNMSPTSLWIMWNLKLYRIHKSDNEGVCGVGISYPLYPLFVLTVN